MNKRIDVFTTDKYRRDLCNDIYFLRKENYTEKLMINLGPFEFGMIFSEVGEIHFHKDFELNRIIADCEMYIKICLEMVENGLFPKKELVNLLKYLISMSRENE